MLRLVYVQQYASFELGAVRARESCPESGKCSARGVCVCVCVCERECECVGECGLYGGSVPFK